MSHLTTTPQEQDLPRYALSGDAQPAAYLFDHARHPRNPALVTAVRSAAARLARKLSALDANRLEISPYIRRHVRMKQESIEAYLQLYAFILAWSLAQNRRPLEDVTFCDYGAGSGVLAMLARELGIGTVIYNDIYDVSCRDAELIARQIGCRADHYVEGDVDALVSFLKANRLELTTIASYDVIEHVYDTPRFLERLPRIVTGGVAMASGANPFNPVTRRKLMQIHREFEYRDRKPREGQKERDTTRSHLVIRRDILREMALGLSDADLDSLARQTRGLKRDDIEIAARAFVATGNAPVPDHPTNTCDPYTGNWQERLMNPYSLAQALRAGGCREAAVIAGYCGCRASHLMRRLAKRGINLMIRAGGPAGLVAAPFYMVCGWKP